MAGFPDVALGWTILESLDVTNCNIKVYLSQYVFMCTPYHMNTAVNPPGTLRQRMKEQTRELILEALMEAMAAGEFEGMTHDALAKKVGVSRQTVYRYFPDREHLLRGLWAMITAKAGPGVGMPENEGELLSRMPETYAGFDAIAPMMVVSLSTPQGRAMRRSMKQERREAYLNATREAVRDLPERDALLATAVIQLLSAGYAWLELREQWDLPGEDVARACQWATRTLLADLRRRKGMPLDAD
jgi:AcrR family transcriptional regulator